MSFTCADKFTVAGGGFTEAAILEGVLGRVVDRGILEGGTTRGGIVEWMEVKCGFPGFVMEVEATGRGGGGGAIEEVGNSTDG